MTNDSMIKKNDILKALWGCDQTNVYFYLVTKRTPKRVELQQIECVTTCSRKQFSMSGTCLPNKDKLIGGVFTKGVVIRDGVDKGVRVEDYMFASPWGGEPVNYTAYA